MPPTVAYLTTEYPGISHTFIFREVQELRKRGFEVKTASVVPTQHLERMTAAEQAEARSTLCIKDQPLVRVFGAHLSLLAGSPLTYARMMARTLQLARRGPIRLLKALAYFAEAGVLLHWMRREGVRHVHVHFGNAAANVAMIAAEDPDITFSVSIHGPDIFHNMDANLLRLKVAEAEFSRCISHFCRSQLEQLAPFAQWKRFPIVRCGVDLNVYSSVARKRDPTRNERPELLCVGRLVPVKGQHVLLEACGRLRARGVPFHLTYVGDGPDRASLEAHCRELALEEAVTFAGVIGQDSIHAYYDRADVFVLASFAEGLPVVLMEAMAKGIPCVATWIAAIPELIDHGENGLLVPASDEEALTNALERLLRDPDLRVRLGQKARAKVEAHYDLARNCTQMADIFRRYLTR